MEIIGEVVGSLISIYIGGFVITAAIFFLGATLNYCQSGIDSAQQGQILVAALLWPRTWWLLIKIPEYWSLAEWQRFQMFKKRRFREKEARALVGQHIVIIHEINIDVGRNENLHIPVGATGRIKGIDGNKKKRFVLDIEWDDSHYQGRPYDLGVGFYGWDKSFFQKGYLALTDR